MSRFNKISKKRLDGILSGTETLPDRMRKKIIHRGAELLLDNFLRHLERNIAIDKAQVQRAPDPANDFPSGRLALTDQ